tara:strand:- start:491 stop:709 length:219 start_codon:yes stop_codon:yes gene_type:complete
MAEENVITIDGTEYTNADLSNEQKYLIAQIKDLQTKAQNVRFQLDQLTVAKDAFTTALMKSVEEKAAEVLAS